MIPLRLSLHNFMSYRDPGQPLDLEGLHVVCLCGDNGHGKSALLDAITWSLWGSVRGMSVGTRGLRTEELVHAGQTDMEVALEFLSGESRYRVIRRHGRARRGPNQGGALELQVATRSDAAPADDPTSTSLPIQGRDERERSFRSISESTLQATQDKLTRLLRMDYETFVNTAFLLQGGSDRFMRADPTQRKYILAEILGLTLYDRLATRSRQQANDAKLRLEQSQTELARLDAELAGREAADSDASRARAGLAALAPQLEDARVLLETARVRLRVLEGRAQDDARQRTDLDTRRRALATSDDRARRVQEQQTSYDRVLAQRDAILQAEAAHDDARATLQATDEQARRHHELQAAALPHQRTIDVARTRLEAQAQAAEGAAADLRARAAAAETHRLALHNVAAQLAALDTEATALSERREEQHHHRAESQRLDAEGKARVEEGKQLKLRLDMLLAQPEPVCPLCNTPLGPEGRAHLTQEMESQRQDMRRRYDEGQSALRDHRARADALARELDAADKALARRREDALRLQERAARALEDAETAQKDLAPAEIALAEVTTRLASGQFAPEAQSGLQRFQEETAALGYDAATHQRLRAEVVVLSSAPDQAHALREAERRLPELAEEAAHLRDVIAAARAGIQESEAAIALLAQELRDRPGLESQVARLAAEHRILHQRQEAAQAALAQARARLTHLEVVAQQRDSLHTTIAALQSDLATYDLLADAFGRNGLQAMLIAEAIPDLEVFANELLAKLTDGRMALKLETEHQTRRGTSVDTLDLLVADELGTRSYELFSGGEAFRVNFALRIALARLLARRAGAPLRALFIDEGFGTQDATGRERLVEAVQAIQSEFDLVVAITHLEEVKEAFPVRIEVTKGDAGSTFRVVT
ncbi:MAG: SMC family ATPase [Dehalococcoidia bacterium]|nr:SMC family ATPase [Dehalococcoidia bacterium]